MRSRFFILSLFVCLTFIAEASAQTVEWQKFSSPEGRFDVLMPGRPLREEESKETPAGKIVMHFFTVGAEKGVFVVAYADLPVSDVKRELDANRDSFLRGMKATLISESDIKILDYPGREIKAARDNLSIRSRIYLVGKRYYQIMAVTPPTLPANLEADRFFNSFELASAAAFTPKL